MLISNQEVVIGKKICQAIPVDPATHFQPDAGSANEAVVCGFPLRATLVNGSYSSHFAIFNKFSSVQRHIADLNLTGRLGLMQLLLFNRMRNRDVPKSAYTTLSMTFYFVLPTAYNGALTKNQDLCWNPYFGRTLLPGVPTLPQRNNFDLLRHGKR
ncbi:hypothetical protein EG68_01876 [Paragonimus skrjabini miyazakii]|uniref:Uncharacterized protein n=1 Tax=Paragonimus skrjabini miyazakii TaxID=59628 RepID=A0A8S9Z7N4_9TREM|nr:hypothetical protein EG68_01876 [Paragonimus skrjabini miyazakii]